MPSVSPTVVDAVELRFRSPATTQNATFHIVGETASGTRHDLVVKPRLAPFKSFNEWVTAELARSLVVNVPTSFAVRFSDLFVESLLSNDRPYFTPNSTVFGCERFRDYLAPQHPLRRELSTDAVRLLVFDTLVQNADRRLDNPNFNVRSDGLIAFDHELVWANRSDVGPGRHDPVLGMRTHWCSEEQFSREALLAQASWLATLSDVAIDSAIAAAAAIWPVDYGDEIASQLKTRRDSAPEWLARLIA